MNWIAINRAMEHYLQGCANVAMTRTPLEALVALHETQTVLIGHLVAAFAQAAELWRKQDGERARITAIRRQASSSPPGDAERQWE